MNFHYAHVSVDDHPHTKTSTQFSVNIEAGILGGDLLGRVVLPNRQTDVRHPLHHGIQVTWIWVGNLGN
jgi:hypothetical protein